MPATLVDGKADCGTVHETPQTEAPQSNLPPSATSFPSPSAVVGGRSRSVTEEIGGVINPSTVPTGLTPDTLGISPDNQAAAGSLLGVLREFMPQKIPKLVQGSAKYLTDSQTSTAPKDDDASINARSIDHLDEYTERQLQNSLPYSTAEKKGKGNDLYSEAGVLRPVETMWAINSDQQGVASIESEGSKYNLMVRVVGLDSPACELLTAFDTQSVINCIFRPALDRLRNVKEHNIPGKLRAYESPLDHKTVLVPKGFVSLRLWFYQISWFVDVKLKILEIPEEVNGFQIILGHKFIRQNGGSVLLGKIEEANSNEPILVAPRSGSFAARSSTRTYNSVADQDGRSHYTKADTELESVFSDYSTVSSATSIGSIESSGSWELIELLLNHDSLHPLYKVAVGKVNAEKFERHLLGFLRVYGDDLKAEAQNEAQIRASNFVRQSVRRTAREIKLAMLKPMDSQISESSGQQERRLDLLSLWLESTQRLQATSTEDSDSGSDESDDENVLMNDNRLNSLSEVKIFLTSSQAFTTLCQSMRSWLRMQDQDVTTEMEPLVAPAGDTTQSMSDEANITHIVDNMTMWSSWRLWIMTLCRPPPAGFKRISYICGCGQPSYVDVRELSPDGIHRFRQRLVQSTNAVRTMQHRRGRFNYEASPLTSSIGIKHIPTFSQPTAPPRQSSGISEVKSGSLQVQTQTIPEDQDITEDQDTPAEQIATQNQNPSEGKDLPPQYLHLCINRKSLPVMSSIEVSSLQNDQSLFQTIYREYRHVRRQYEWRISLLVPSSVRNLFYRVFAPLATFVSSRVRLGFIQRLFHTISQWHLYSIESADFVRFQLIPVREECCPAWFKQRSFPPADEVLNRRYLYAPVPMEDVELADIPLSHLLMPGPHTDFFWMVTVPKKLGQPLTRHPGTTGQRVIGWGIRINEYLNWVFILCYILVLLIAIGIIVVAYAAITSDKSTAFGLGAYLVAIATVYTSYQYLAWKSDETNRCLY